MKVYGPHKPRGRPKKQTIRQQVYPKKKHCKAGSKLNTKTLRCNKMKVYGPPKPRGRPKKYNKKKGSKLKRRTSTLS